jgi:hypothetical protein
LGYFGVELREDAAMTPIYSASASSESEYELVTIAGEKSMESAGFVLRSPVHFDDSYDDDYEDLDEDEDDLGDDDDDLDDDDLDDDFDDDDDEFGDDEDDFGDDEDDEFGYDDDVEYDDLDE